MYNNKQHPAFQKHRTIQYLMISTLIFLFSALAWAAPVSRQVADTTAQDWAYLHGWHLQEAGWTPTARDAEPEVVFAGELKDTQDEIVAYKYRFPTGGEVVIVNEDGLVPVFFYSETNTFDPNANPTAKALFEELIAKIKLVRENEQTVPHVAWTAISGKSQSYRTSKMNARSIAASTTGPLIRTTWNQSGNDPSFPTYEYYCPIYENEHCIVGCVATAMAQIMRYWEYPDRGQGSIFYVTGSLEIPVSVPDFSEPPFDWANMPLSLSSNSSLTQIKAVAQLSFYCGASVQMDYTPMESGAYSYNAREALVNHFKYPNHAELIYRYSYEMIWDALMRDQILRGQPVYYSGYHVSENDIGGHAFILDGVQDSAQGDLFHFNLGWGGSANGWYTSSNPVRYDTEQHAIINIGIGRQLNVTTVPTNAGAVVTTPSGKVFINNSTIEIKAIPYGGYIFSNWAGDATGTDKVINLTMDCDKSVTAVFVPGYKICLQRHGEGTISCTPDADGYLPGTTVTLQATPATGWKFDHWDGDVTGYETSTTITVNRDQLVHAYFVPDYYIHVIPTGRGTVARSVEGPGYKPNTRITLTATPAQGWVFRKWWGDLDSTQNPITITADSNKLIQAEFVNPSLENFPLTINVVGDGRVFPFGGSFARDSQVTLTPTPAQGWKFVQWRGDIVSKENPMKITIDRNWCITGVFIEEDAPMPADETIGIDSQDSPTTSNNDEEISAKNSTEKSGDFEFANLFNSCTLLATVLIGLMFGGFASIRIKQ